MKTFGLCISRDRTNISVFGKVEPGEDQAWLITYSDHPSPLTTSTSASPCSHNMKRAWQPFFSLLPSTPLFVLCTKHVDLWKPLLLSLCFFEIMVFLMHSMGIFSQPSSPILLWATQVYLLSAQAPIFNFDLQEIFCIVEGGQNQAHPFRRTRDAVAGNEDFTVTHSPWTNRWVINVVISFSSSLTPVRLHVTYRRLIPAIEVSSSTF